jgi:hypothetical protein
VATLGRVVPDGFVGVMLGHRMVRSLDQDKRRIGSVGHGQRSAEQSQGGYSNQLLHIPFLPAISPGKNYFICVGPE